MTSQQIDGIINFLVFFVPIFPLVLANLAKRAPRQTPEA